MQGIWKQFVDVHVVFIMRVNTTQTLDWRWGGSRFGLSHANTLSISVYWCRYSRWKRIQSMPQRVKPDSESEITLEVMFEAVYLAKSVKLWDWRKSRYTSCVSTARWTTREGRSESPNVFIFNPEVRWDLAERIRLVFCVWVRPWFSMLTGCFYLALCVGSSNVNYVNYSLAETVRNKMSCFSLSFHQAYTGLGYSVLPSRWRF